MPDTLHYEVRWSIATDAKDPKEAAEVGLYWLKKQIESGDVRLFVINTKTGERIGHFPEEAK
jgi:hypothetical protein